MLYILRALSILSKTDLMCINHFFAATGISDETASACLVFLPILHCGDLLFLLTHNLILYQSHLLSTPYLCLYLQELKRWNKFNKEKVLLENLLWNRTSFCWWAWLPYTEWLVWENMQPVNLSAMLSICSSLIDQGQNGGNSFWGVTKIIDGED